MIDCITRPVPIHHAPAVEAALAALDAHLTDNHYSTWATSRILAHVRRTGELSGAVSAGLLEPSDEPAATDVYVDALPPVPLEDHAWGDPGIYLDLDSLLEPRGSCSIAPPEEGDRSIPAGARLIPPELDELDELAEFHPLALAPICGGSPLADQRDDAQVDDRDPMAFPRLKSPEDRRQDQADILAFYRLNPGA